MASGNKLELVVEVDVNKANASIKSVNTLMAALKLGVRISLDEIREDEFRAMLIVAEERDLLEREKLPGQRTR
jgi:hypothetical protein